MKLNIQNFNHLTKWFDGTDYRINSFGTSESDYNVSVLHRNSGERYLFTIKRDGYFTGGEWHYTTNIEGDSVYGSVTWRFMKDPSSFVRHIIASIEP